MLAVLKQKPDKMTLRALKAVSVPILFLITLFLIVVIYIGLYKIVNVMDTKAYFRYASDGKFTQDIYFEEAEEKGAEIYSTLGNVIPDAVIPPRIQEHFKILLQNEKFLKEEMNKNNGYVEYLASNNATVNDVISYMKKIVKLDDIFLYAGIYVGMLIFILTLYFLYKWRIGLFIFSGILYFILVVDSFMAGIFLDSFFLSFQSLNNFLNHLEGNGNGYLVSYDDYLMLSKNVLPATREAALTFIIVDTVVQSMKDSKKRKRSSKFLASYCELEFTLNFLKQMKGNLVITNLKTVDLEAIYYFCKENKEDRHLIEVVTNLDEWKKVTRNQKMTVTELHDRLLSVRNVLKESKFIRENIIR
ncbi:hypothetical protein [Paenibacillus glacialis]|uniref:Uncharacterized protein n=1 Tax=Paenibacillus glacialis TaxID=494026 RepID=A0A168M3I7_9BACL|nr:hypothetical protein [Paenibacillus glacialis]OAB44175.1 hypothetical protein PGLA_05755 [Paenibacillus glacialis]